MKELNNIQIRILDYLSNKTLPSPLINISEEVVKEQGYGAIFSMALDMEKMGLVDVFDMPLKDGKLVEITQLGRKVLLDTLTAHRLKPDA